MLYNRKIKYLDYYENGTKVNTGGFAKLEVRDNTLRIELTVRGLHTTDSFERDIVLQGAEKEEALGRIRIQNGCGQFRYSCEADQEIGTTGISYSELRGIRISIGGTREILCQWDNVSNKRRITPSEESTQEPNPDLLQPGIELKAERHVDKKAETGDSVHAESDQPLTFTPEKADKAEEKYESGEDKDRENRDRENRDREDKGIDRDGSREDKDIDKDRDEGRDRNKEEDRESKGGEGQENKALKADAVKECEKQEGKEKDNDRSETKKDISMFIQPGMIEMQAQGASINSDVISPRFSEEPSQTDFFPSEGQPQDQAGDSAFTVGGNREDQADAPKGPVKLMEDKWQQLSSMYPHIQPFRDERDYLSLTPSDFVLFPNRFYRAVNNSFLLHGYYNYHHLILARIEHRGEILYYIGVPGNYFEREKQVALMFGFESFECESEPAKTGDFGYYMMRTEL